jgi:N-acetylglucosamine-1-phosphodiester alpha-N-acetylglucosaminidase
VQGSGGFGMQFGVTDDGQWVIGNLKNASVAAQLKVTYSVPGFGWLVRDGKNAMAEPDTYIAPRTTIGVTKTGQLLILEVDGCEPQRGCRFKIGKTEYHMAELLLAHGAYHAINLDGGGSSSFVVNGTVVNHPTDTDLWAVKKERAVTVITCVV